MLSHFIVIENAFDINEWAKDMGIRFIDDLVRIMMLPILLSNGIPFTFQLIDKGFQVIGHWR